LEELKAMAFIGHRAVACKHPAKQQIIGSSGRGFVLTAKGVRAVKLLLAEKDDEN
jgi:hypothetical protein